MSENKPHSLDEELNNNVLKVDGVTVGETSDSVDQSLLNGDDELYGDESDVINSFMHSINDEVSNPDFNKRFLT